MGTSASEDPCSGCTAGLESDRGGGEGSGVGSAGASPSLGSRVLSTPVRGIGNRSTAAWGGMTLLDHANALMQGVSARLGWQAHPRAAARCSGPPTPTQRPHHGRCHTDHGAASPPNAAPPLEIYARHVPWLPLRPRSPLVGRVGGGPLVRPPCAHDHCCGPAMAACAAPSPGSACLGRGTRRPAAPWRSPFARIDPLHACGPGQLVRPRILVPISRGFSRSASDSRSQNWFWEWHVMLLHTSFTREFDSARIGI